MKIKLYRSSTIGLNLSGYKILMDPWLTDGEYYGSWSHYPYYDLDKNINEINCLIFYINHFYLAGVPKPLKAPRNTFVNSSLFITITFSRIDDGVYKSQNIEFQIIIFGSYIKDKFLSSGFDSTLVSG